MADHWPSYRIIKKNTTLLGQHQRASECGIKMLEESGFFYKRGVCSGIGDPDSYVPRKDYGPLNWDFIQDSMLETLNGPTPADGKSEFNRRRLYFIAVTQIGIDALVAEEDFEVMDPERMLRMSPMRGGGIPTEGWFSIRDPRFDPLLVVCIDAMKSLNKASKTAITDMLGNVLLRGTTQVARIAEILQDAYSPDVVGMTRDDVLHGRWHKLGKSSEE